MPNKKDKKMTCTTTKDGVKLCWDSDNPPKAETPISSEGQFMNPTIPERPIKTKKDKDTYVF